MRHFALVLPLLFLLASCGEKEPAKTEYQMGEKAKIGKLTYSVVDTTWKPQLGEGFKLRVPERRFMLVRLSVENNSGKEITLPLFTLIGQNGEEIKEAENGEGVDGWFGLFRTVPAGGKQEGVALFDVSLTSYRLRLPDGGDTGEEKYGFINIPLRMDVDTQPKIELPGQK